MSNVAVETQVQVADLPLYARSRVSLYHWTGKLLVARGQFVTPDIISALKEAGIESVYTTPGLHARPEAMERMDVYALSEGTCVPKDLYAQDGSLVLHANEPISAAAIDTLHRRGQDKLYYFAARENGQAALFEAGYVSLVRGRLDKEIASGDDALKPHLAGIALARMTRVYSGRPRPKATLDATAVFYQRAALRLNALWQRLAAGDFLWQSELAPLTDEILSRFLSEKEVLAALAAGRLDLPVHPEHCLATAVYSLFAASRLGYNRAQARQLVMAALFHDVGHTMVPDELTEARRGLTRDERAQVSRHVDYDILLMGRLDWPSEGFAIPVYQHHERGIGGGYPTGATADRIHEYAGILAAADVFHAFISDRPHRRAYLPGDAMQRCLKMAGMGLLDGRAVRVLADQLSLYPIGAVVALTNGEIARVVAASRDPRRPWAGTILETDGTRLETPRIRDLSTLPGVSILHEVPPIGDALSGF